MSFSLNVICNALQYCITIKIKSYCDHIVCYPQHNLLTDGDFEESFAFMSLSYGPQITWKAVIGDKNAGGSWLCVNISKDIHSNRLDRNNLHWHCFQLCACRRCCRVRGIRSYAAEVCRYMLVVISRWLNAGTQFDLALLNDACKPHWPPVRSSDLASHCPVCVIAHIQCFSQTALCALSHLLIFSELLKGNTSADKDTLVSTCWCDTELHFPSTTFSQFARGCSTLCLACPFTFHLHPSCSPLGKTQEIRRFLWHN